MAPISASPGSRSSSSSHLFRRPCAWLLTALVLYLLTFAAFAFPWLRRINDAIPTYPYTPDEMLVVWVLAWVSHALLDPQANVFDANIYHPAPAQLTGSEHLFFLQSLFTPLYLLTDQPVLATGVVTFLTYPLGALAMAALLVRIGCSRLVAWLCGLTYALGILRVPLNFHTLQYPNLFLPLVALSAVRAHDAPGLRSWVWLFLSLLAALLTSYYTAGIVCVALGLWMFGELLISRRRIVPFVTTIGLALLAAGLVAALVLHPYIVRSEGMALGHMPWDHGGHLWAYTLLAVGYWYNNGEMWRIPFAFLPLLGIGGRGDVAWRRMALVGTVVCSIATMLVIAGLPDWLGQLAARTPLRNFRGWVRLFLVTDFGLCLLAAAGLDLCRRRLGIRVAMVPIAAFAFLTAVPRLTRLVDAMNYLPDTAAERADAYRKVKRYTDELGRGPLLELPAGVTTDCQAMLGSTFHWLPLLNGFTGYEPAHVRAMRAATGALPDAAALQDLVDLSHLRWILVRPNWVRPRVAERIRQGLAASTLIGRSFSFDGFTLFEVSASPTRPRWYAAIAAGPRPGTTALGTPIRRLSPAEAIAMIEPVDEIRDVAGTSTLQLRLRNAGTADWPVLLGGVVLPFDDVVGRLYGRTFAPLSFHLEARWVPLPETASSAGHQGPVQNIALNRDVLAGESLMQALTVPRPSLPGRYRLDVRVVQKDGPELTEPPSRMLHEVIDLSSPSASPRSQEGREQRRKQE